MMAKANASAVAKKHKQHPAELTVTDIGDDKDRWFDAIITADVVDKQGERLDPHGFTLKEYRDILEAPIIDTHSNVTIGRFDPDSLDYTQVHDPRSGKKVNAIRGRGRIFTAEDGYEEYPVWRQVWDHIKQHAKMGKPSALSIGGDPDPEKGKQVVCEGGKCYILVPKVYWHETSIVRDERGGANPLATVSNINAMAKGPASNRSAILKFGFATPFRPRIIKARNYPYAGEDPKPRIRMRADVNTPPNQAVAGGHGPQGGGGPGPMPASAAPIPSPPPPVPQQYRTEAIGSRPPPVPQEYQVESPTNRPPPFNPAHSRFEFDPVAAGRQFEESRTAYRAEQRQKYRQEATERRAQAEPRPDPIRIRSHPATMDLQRALREFEQVKNNAAQAEALRATNDEEGIATAEGLQAAYDAAKQKLEAALAAFQQVREEANKQRSDRGLDPERIRNLRGTEHEHKGLSLLLKLNGLDGDHDPAGVHEGHQPTPIGTEEWTLDEREHVPRPLPTEVKEALGSGAPGSFAPRIVHRSDLEKKKVPTQPYQPKPPLVRKPAQEQRQRVQDWQGKVTQHQRQTSQAEAVRLARRELIPRAVADPAYQQRFAQWSKKPEAERGKRPEPPGLPKVPEVGPKPDDLPATMRPGPPTVYDKEPPVDYTYRKPSGVRQTEDDLWGQMGIDQAELPEKPEDEDAEEAPRPAREPPTKEVTERAPAQRVTPPQRSGVGAERQRLREGENVPAPAKPVGPPKMSPRELREGSIEDEARMALREALESPRPDVDLPDEIREPDVRDDPVNLNPRVQSVRPGPQGPTRQPFAYTETEGALRPQVYPPAGGMVPAQAEQRIQTELAQNPQVLEAFDAAKAQAMAARQEFEAAVSDPGATDESRQAAQQAFEAAIADSEQTATAALQQVPGATLSSGKRRGHLAPQARAMMDEMRRSVLTDKPKTGGKERPGISRRERQLMTAPNVLDAKNIVPPERPIVLDRLDNKEQHEAQGYEVRDIDDVDGIKQLVSILPDIEERDAKTDDLAVLANWVVEMGDAVQALGNLDAAAAKLMDEAQRLDSMGQEEQAQEFETLAQRASRARGILQLARVGQQPTGPFAGVTEALGRKTNERRERRIREEMGRRQAALRGPTSFGESPLMRGGQEATGLDHILAAAGGTTNETAPMDDFDPEGNPIQTPQDFRQPALPSLEQLVDDPEATSQWIRSQNKDLKTSLLKATPEQLRAYWDRLASNAKQLLENDPGGKKDFEQWLQAAADKIDEAKLLERDLDALGPAARRKYERLLASGQATAKPKAQPAPKVNREELQIERMRSTMQLFNLPTPWIEESVEEWLQQPPGLTHFRLSMARTYAEPDDHWFKQIMMGLREKLVERHPQYFERFSTLDQQRYDQAMVDQEMLRLKEAGAAPAQADPEFTARARADMHRGGNPTKPHDKAPEETTATKSLSVIRKIGAPNYRVVFAHG